MELVELRVRRGELTWVVIYLEDGGGWEGVGGVSDDLDDGLVCPLWDLFVSTTNSKEQQSKNLFIFHSVP